MQTPDQQHDAVPRGQDRLADASATSAHGGGTPAASTATPTVLVAFGTPRNAQIRPGQRVRLPRLPDTQRPPAVMPPRGHTARTRRRALQAGALVAAVVIGLVAVLAVLSNSGPGPRDLVRDFFSQLTARDTSRLPAAARCSRNPLCQPGALRVGYQPPEHLRIESERSQAPSSPRPGTKERLIKVSYDIDGQHLTDAVTVLYQRAGIFSGFWSISDPPGSTITMPKPAIAPATLAAAKLDMPTPEEQLTFWAPPGRYTATRPGNALYEPAEATAVVADTPVTITLPATLKPTLTTHVEQQIHDRINACAAQRVFKPDTDMSSPNLHNCPMVHLTPYAITTEPLWTVQRYPTIRLDTRPDGTVTVITITSGKATIHYQWSLSIRDPRDWNTVTATYDLNVDGFARDVDGRTEWIAG
ncbi:hypothetical protein AB0K00_21655 [Dactylosporangium sp. NPDC049525]|uniref:hypothetical protein n=1 Tax=Dactylosporangium sp. NPDC049525 TaxID=3154730 RepID=UPI003424B262